MASKPRNIAGEAFGRLTALEATDKRHRGCVVWRCSCQCGNMCEVSSAYLLSDRIRSCGCLVEASRGKGPFVLPGSKFNHLTVESRAEGKNMWLCRCDCGNAKAVKSAYLRTGDTKSCGCMSHKADGVKPGQVFTRLTTVKRVDRGPEFKKAKNRYAWLCECQCGETSLVAAWKLKNGTVRSCGCLRAEFQYKGEGVSGLLHTIRTYKRSATDKGRCFSLTDEEARVLLLGRCHYCGTEPRPRKNKNIPLRGRVNMNGIDRVDNSRGYEKDNCVSCCVICNIAKRNMAVDEFRSWVGAVSAHLTESKW